MSASISAFASRRLEVFAVLLAIALAFPASAAEPSRAAAKRALADAQRWLARGDLDATAEQLLVADRLAAGAPMLEVAVDSVAALFADARGASGMPIRYRAVLLDARAAGAVEVEAATEINYANHLAQRGEASRSALRARYEAAAVLARRAGRDDLILRAWLGLARAAGPAEPPAAKAALKRALAAISPDASPTRRARELLAIAEIAVIADIAPTGLDTLELYAEAASEAARAADPLLAAEVVGLEGEAYAARHEHRRALNRFELALIASGGRAELEYRWLWGIARSRAALGDREGALDAYAAATARLNDVRRSLPVLDAYGGSFFSRRVEPVYREHAELLVDVGDLAAARSSIEELKAAELENYFRDDCVERRRTAERIIGELAEDTAVLYPLIMPDRLELVVELQDRLFHVSSPVRPTDLGAIADRFATGLAREGTVDAEGAQLYDWLIAPIIDELRRAQVRTVVFVPDGPLRQVPLAALPAPEGDGAYLIQRFAFVQTPGLTLAGSGTGDVGRILAAGLTMPPEDEALPPLPHVTRELRTLRDRFGAEVLPGATFTRDRLEARLSARSFGIVHIATHAEFAGSVAESRLIAPGGDIGLDDLETMMLLTSFRTQPVDLLTLSACQTARGDDRALLGLAGIAVKSGARSALATLWLIEDEAAADLSAAFYTALLEDGLDKARALQRAQIEMLRAPGTAHPYHWAAFILIGHWL